MLLPQDLQRHVRRWSSRWIAAQSGSADCAFQGIVITVSRAS